MSMQHVRPVVTCKGADCAFINSQSVGALAIKCPLLLCAAAHALTLCTLLLLLLLLLCAVCVCAGLC